MDDPRCWQCGQPLEDLILPVSRREECRHCRAEIHTCRQCRHYHPQVAGQCREERAEDVSDTDRANFCDYYAFKADAWQPGDDDADARARAELDALFGGEPTSGETSSPLDDLFDPDKLKSSD